MNRWSSWSLSICLRPTTHSLCTMWSSCVWWSNALVSAAICDLVLHESVQRLEADVVFVMPTVPLPDFPDSIQPLLAVIRIYLVECERRALHPKISVVSFFLHLLSSDCTCLLSTQRLYFWWWDRFYIIPPKEKNWILFHSEGELFFCVQKLIWCQCWDDMYKVTSLFI